MIHLTKYPYCLYINCAYPDAEGPEHCYECQYYIKWKLIREFENCTYPPNSGPSNCKECSFYIRCLEERANDND